MFSINSCSLHFLSLEIFLIIFLKNLRKSRLRNFKNFPSLNNLKRFLNWSVHLAKSSYLWKEHQEIPMHKEIPRKSKLQTSFQKTFHWQKKETIIFSNLKFIDGGGIGDFWYPVYCETIFCQSISFHEPQKKAIIETLLRRKKVDCSKAI